MGTNALVSLRDWLREAPPGTSVDAARIADRIDELIELPNPTPLEPIQLTWKERLWSAPPETRIGRAELLEAVGRSANWLYRHTSGKSECVRIPHRKLDGELVFLVAEVREWLIEQEEVIVKGRTEPMVVPLKRRSLGASSSA